MNEADHRPRQPRVETSASVRNAIIELYRANISKNEIAHRLNINRRTVYRWLKRHDEGQGLINQRRNGRPRCTTEEGDEQILHFVHGQPFTTSTVVKRETDLQISRHTIYRRLREGGLECRIPARKPFLTPAHTEHRLGFALQHLAKDKHVWENIIWCDEKTFCNDKHGKLHCWRPPKK